MCFAVSHSFAQPFAQQLFTFLEPVEFRNALCQWRKNDEKIHSATSLSLWIWGFAGVLQSTAVFVVQGALLNSLFWAKLTRYPPDQCLMASKIDLNLDFQTVKFQVTAKRNLKSLNRTDWSNWTNCCSDRSGIADAPGELWAYCQPDWGCGNGGLIATGRWRVEEFARRCFSKMLRSLGKLSEFCNFQMDVGHFESLRASEATFVETLRQSQKALVAFVTPWCGAWMWSQVVQVVSNSPVFFVCLEVHGMSIVDAGIGESSWCPGHLAN